MKKPTQLEVKICFQAKGVYDQHEIFFAYYTSIGWYVGKTKMRSWKAAVAGWVLRMEAKEDNTKHIMKSSMKPTKE